jgi:hypothetical protein
MSRSGGHSAARLGVALLTFVALGVQLARSPSVANFFSFFTVQSNLLAATVLLVAAVRGRSGRDLAPLDMWRGAAALVHYLMPVVVVADWILAPPRRRIRFGRALLWLVYPVGYLVYSLVRGALVGWYPYPFLDPTRGAGYGGVAVAAAGIAVGAVGFTAVLLWAARRAGTPVG